MQDTMNKQKTSNAGDISLGLLAGGAVLMVLGSKLRLVGLPIVMAGAASSLAGASMRREANDVVGGMTGEDQLWVKLRSSVLVMRPPQELYTVWRDPLNWPKFMPDIDITPSGTDRYELRKRIAPGFELMQEILISEDLPFHRLAWVSLNEHLPSRGSVEFTTDGGTYVTLTWEYKTAVGPLVNSMSRMSLKSLNEILLVKLQRFKQIMEQGGATTYGPTGCKATSAQLLLHVLKTDADRAIDDLSESAVSS